ncbi:hypothetical protein LPMP_120440 [Leishmania panamensis]|uniref:Uncharacterized protein n=1 Tax=Leishmania panamensis TaxID=5679 RepID=A0A088RK31_LEIPA|nr:hypothetical protein LPMP_120440 [Leishmania panamensis]AIN96372.1 hypothetical protein LPMP_120440 [Leishmania panamensis]
MPVSFFSSASSDSAAGGGHSTEPPTDMIHLKDALGMLWYAFLLARESHQQPGCQSMWSGVKRTEEDGPLKKDTAAAVEGQHRSSGDVGVDSGSEPKGNTGASISPSTSTTAVSPSAAAQREDCEFDRWGDVDWTLLAAHVYALTRELLSARTLHRIVAEDIYKGMYNGNREAMCAAYALQHAKMLAFHAKEVQEEEERAAVAARLQTPLTINASIPSGSRLAGTAGVLQTAPPAGASSSIAEAPVACLPSMVAIQDSQSSLPTSGNGDGSAAPSLPSTRCNTRTSSLAPPRAAASSLPVSPPLSEAISDARVGVLLVSAGATTATYAPGTSPAPFQGDTDVVGRHGVGGTERGVTTDHMQLGLPPHAQPGSVAGGLQRGTLAVAGQSAASSGESLGPDAVYKGDHAVLPSATHQSLPFEPDPLDAPWYALWCSLPSQQARTQLHLLRYATPIPLEDFSSLLEQFFLVDGADDFLSPVHATTIMEFAGVRSGPYNTIVRSPLSLAEVRRYISESHRHYARAAVAVHTSHGESVARVEARSRPSSGPPSLDPASALGMSSTLETSNAIGSGGCFLAPSVAAATRAEYRGLRRGGAPSPGAFGSDVRSLLDSTASSERRILTLAELERSVWHIAANCVVFNAPESRYPRTARHFAASCIAIMTRYCEKQLAALYAT